MSKPSRKRKDPKKAKPAIEKRIDRPHGLVGQEAKQPKIAVESGPKAMAVAVAAEPPEANNCHRRPQELCLPGKSQRADVADVAPRHDAGLERGQLYVPDRAFEHDREPV